MAPSSSSSAGGTTSVQVAVRIRPTTTQDTNSIPTRFQRAVVSAGSSNTVVVDQSAAGSTSGPTPAAALASSKKQTFAFDQVHPPLTTQHALFVATAQPLISRFLEGFNCTILAYGQTSSGKTFTMTGVDLEADPSDPTNGMGIIPRAVSTIFQQAREVQAEKGSSWSYSIKGSFIEIYNEDLLDLLSMDDATGGRREVQIREDKDGHIIWSGLREVAVRNSNEVMSLIRKGAAIRRTNETDMNAQSSRSHAIFSLTLTQKKFTGSAGPPRSASPLPPGGRSPSRLARPASSAYSGPGGRLSHPPRSSTPSLPPTSHKMSGGLRPASSLGFAGADEEGQGEWITVVSKFHFVDLAGSERLKRTSAQGERVKEGISINSGLLALGNVISALGDPSRAKSNTASHVPYRDSKLTRLLQDSLGGNAHTLMIACVSPAEYNAGETINTLKYANRARNIKNRAVVNEKEEGWDDVEWLQNMVTRLRKEVKSLKDGGVTPGGSGADHPEPLEGAGKKVLAQVTDLQNNYEDLREKFVERTEELTRLRRELAEKQAPASGGTAKYEEIVGPVIEEYEKTISAMEAELGLNRAALRHTNEMVEEKEQELAVVTERHSTTELYVEELKSRVAKLSEREASTEAYVHDLEEKVKTYDESSMTSSGSITDLKREIARFKDTESHSSRYIADLEARLARSDESVLALQQTVERLEKESERRRDEVEVLQSRLDTISKDGEDWRTDLEMREERVRELEAKLEAWEVKKAEAAEDRDRLGTVVDEVSEARKAFARRSLEQELTPRSSKIIVNGVNGSHSSSDERYDTSDRETPTKSDGSEDSVLQGQLSTLQETHAATLADLSSVTAKYRDALREISDLAGQIQEAKLQVTPAESSPEKTEVPTISRRRHPSRQTSDYNYPGTGRRLFFRHAASTESLHSRSLSQSVSLSQELSSATSRKTSFSSVGSASPGPHSASPYLSSSMSLPLPMSDGPPPDRRSVAKMEKEIMRLQEVLKQREGEISVLERSLKERGKSRHISDMTKLSSPNGDANPKLHLSPQTMHQFSEIRKSMEIRRPPPTDNEGSLPSEVDENLDRLNELMRSMAQKESQHQETVEELSMQLAQLQRQHDELTALSKDQTLNMSREIEGLQRDGTDRHAKLEELQAREAQLAETLDRVQAEHAAEVENFRLSHEAALRTKEAEVDGLLAQVKQHEDDNAALIARLEESSVALAKAHEDHQAAFGQLKAEHEAELQRRSDEVDQLLERTRSEHVEALQKKDEEHSIAMQRTEEEYYNALTKLRDDNARNLEKQAAEASLTLQRLREDHEGQLRVADQAREASLTESASTQGEVLRQLQEELSVAAKKREADYADDIVRLKASHSDELNSRDAQQTSALEQLSGEHNSAIQRIQRESAKALEELRSELASHQRAAEQSQKEADISLRRLQENHAAVLQELERDHAQEVATLKNAHEASVNQSKSEADLAQTSLGQSHAEQMATLKAEHQKAMADVNARLIAVQDQHLRDLEESRAQSTRHATAERERLQSLLAEMEQAHNTDRDTLRKDRDLLADELASHKAAAEEHAMAREETRIAHEEVALLRAELEKTRAEQTKLVQDASKRESLVEELDRHRSLLAEVQDNLQRTRDERDAISAEKTRQDTTLKDLEARIMRSSSPPQPEASPVTLRPQRSTGIQSGKLPPITPPPTMPPPAVPPPPLPRTMSGPLSNGDSSVGASLLTASISGRDSQFDTPPTSAAHSATASNLGSGLPPVAVDPKLAAKVEQQQKQLEEQEVMIKTLEKQLSHCESDLQTHMDLVNTLEASLGDSEKNLRKARMQATELARERDGLQAQIETVRRELSDAKREVVNVRQSIVEEKQSLETRLDEERRAKERARAQLDLRLAEHTKRKSKFACM